jgi:hypothetical protein
LGISGVDAEVGTGVAVRVTTLVGTGVLVGVGFGLGVGVLVADGVAVGVGATQLSAVNDPAGALPELVKGTNGGFSTCT